MKTKNVLITGAASGIGLALAKKFGKEGYNLILADINTYKLDKVCKEFNKANVDCWQFAYNVADQYATNAIAREIITELDGIDILINNAGVGCSQQLEQTSISQWQHLMDINFWGPLYQIHAFLDHMKENGGHIVNVSSGQAFFKLPGWGAYATSKVALGAFSEILGFELKKYDINVTTVYPFMVDTPFYEGVGGTNTFLSNLSMNLIPYYSQTPEKVADIIFRAVKKKKRRESVSLFNDFAFYAQTTPVYSLVSTVVDYFMNKKKS